MSSRSLKSKILTKVKKGTWIPKIKRRKGNNDKNEPISATSSSIEQQKELTYQEYSIKTPASIINLPTEIYLQIFGYLLFTDLYTLSCVSKFFRDLLWSKSEFTQSIWKNCRLIHYPNYPKLPPPKGMCEQQYIWITLAAKTCQFCKETYKKTSYDKWSTKINCCNHCMASDTYTIEEYSVNRTTVSFPHHLKGCIPYTEYIGYINDNTSEKRNHHKYYFIKDIDKITKEYDSLTEEERQGWIENKRKELKDYLEKIKDYQAQDCAYYWSQFTFNQPEKFDDDDEDDDIVEEEDIDQDYDQDYNQDYIINSFNNLNNYNYNNINAFNNLNNLSAFSDLNAFSNFNSYNTLNQGFAHQDTYNQVYSQSYLDYDLDEDDLNDYNDEI